MADLEEMVNRARDGDAGAFDQIVRRFQDMAVGYGYSLVGDIGFAEDAAQEAFLEAYLCLPQLREPAAFPGWFRRIVFKQCDRITRGKTGRFEPLDGVEPPSPLPDEDAGVEPHMKDQLWNAIDVLPENERAVVVLYYFSGYSQKEIAGFLDVPVTAIKKRLFTTRERMRETMMDAVVDSLRERRPSRNEDFGNNVREMLTSARTGDVVRVSELMKRNRRLLTARDWLGNTALIMAVNSGQDAVAELLMRAGVHPDMHEAAAIGQTSRVRELLLEDRQRLDAYSLEGFTPLGLAAHFGHLETATFLIDQGANLDAISRHPVKVTPLHAALFGRQIDTARLLIDRGADVNVRRGGEGWPRSGWTALHYAAAEGVIEFIEYLLARKADPNVVDDDGRTPFDVALEFRHESAADPLRRAMGGQK